MTEQKSMPYANEHDNISTMVEKLCTDPTFKFICDNKDIVSKVQSRNPAMYAWAEKVLKIPDKFDSFEGLEVITNKESVEGDKLYRAIIIADKNSQRDLSKDTKTKEFYQSEKITSNNYIFMKLNSESKEIFMLVSLPERIDINVGHRTLDYFARNFVYAGDHAKTLHGGQLTVTDSNNIFIYGSSGSFGGEEKDHYNTGKLIKDKLGINTYGRIDRGFGKDHTVKRVEIA